MFRPEPLDLVIVLIVALLIFGPQRLPELSRSMGKAIREFREAVASQTGQEEHKPPRKPDEAS